MNKNNSIAEEVQGTESDLKVPDVDQVEKWLTKDLGTCITFLSALHNDAELRRQMAIFLQGRITNFKNKPDPNQGDLFPKR